MTWIDVASGHGVSKLSGFGQDAVAPDENGNGGDIATVPVGIGGGFGAGLGLSVGVFALVMIAAAVAVNYQLGKAMAPTERDEYKWAWGNAIAGTLFPPFTIGMAVYKNYFAD